MKKIIRTDQIIGRNMHTESISPSGFVLFSPIFGLMFEYYSNDGMRYHNLNRPAVLYIFKNHKIHGKRYFCSFMMLSKLNWQNKIKNL